MAKKVCKNCKHWAEKEENVKGIRQCTRVSLFWDSTTWSKDDTPARVLREENKLDKAFVQDGSDYWAELVTREDFGCNQFEKIVE